MAQISTPVSLRKREGELETARCAWLLACDLASKATGADVRVVLQTSGTRGRRVDNTTARARKLACYLAVVVGNTLPGRLAEAAMIDKKTVHDHLQWVEDERERPEFDGLLDRLEKAMVRMAVQIVMANLTEAAA
jgi:hypothetical protein